MFSDSDSKFFQLCVDKLDNMITTHKFAGIIDILYYVIYEGLYISIYIKFMHNYSYKEFLM